MRTQGVGQEAADSAKGNLNSATDNVKSAANDTSAAFQQAGHNKQTSANANAQGAQAQASDVWPNKGLLKAILSHDKPSAASAYLALGSVEL